MQKKKPREIAYDDILASLVAQGKAQSFKCTPEYKGKSVVPSRITITSGKDGVDVFTQTIEVWDKYIAPDEKYLYKKPGYSYDE